MISVRAMSRFQVGSPISKHESSNNNNNNQFEILRMFMSSSCLIIDVLSFVAIDGITDIFVCTYRRNMDLPGWKDILKLKKIYCEHLEQRWTNDFCSKEKWATVILGIYLHAIYNSLESRAASIIISKVIRTTYVVHTYLK